MTAEHTIALLMLLSGCVVENEVPTCRADDVVINEVLAGSHGLVTFGANVDWIELFNASDQAVELEGWSLSRTPTEHEFEFPAGELASGDQIVVIADTFVGDGSHLVSGFDLNRDGDALFLRASALDAYALCNEVIYPDQHADFSWKRAVDGGEDWCFASEPSPEESNEDTLCICGETGAGSWC